MPIPVSSLRTASAQLQAPTMRNLNEARSRGWKTAFLCHSHRDEVLAAGLVKMLHGAGFQLYVDWADAEMPEKPDRETARRIKEKIVDLQLFLFLATGNSMASRWCPWEIGYADGKKPIDSIIVVPTIDGVTTHGNEYLELYRRLDLTSIGGLAVWQPGQTYDIQASKAL